MAVPATYLTQLSLKNVKSFLGAHFLDMTDEKGRPARWTLILGDNGVGKTTLLECLAHLAPDFNSDDKDSSKDPLMFIEPSIAASQNDVIDNLGRNGNIEFEIEATFAVDSRLSSGLRSVGSFSMTFFMYSRRVLSLGVGEDLLDSSHCSTKSASTSGGQAVFWPNRSDVTIWSTLQLASTAGSFSIIEWLSWRTTTARFASRKAWAISGLWAVAMNWTFGK